MKQVVDAPLFLSFILVLQAGLRGRVFMVLNRYIQAHTCKYLLLILVFYFDLIASSYSGKV